MNSIHPKVELIRRLVVLLKETTEYSIHEDHCGVINFSSCNCLTGKIREAISDVESYLQPENSGPRDSF